MSRSFLLIQPTTDQSNSQAISAIYTISSAKMQFKAISIIAFFLGATAVIASPTPKGMYLDHQL